MTTQIEGKVAIVTGAAGGIGLATSKLLAQKGVNVVMVDKNPSVIGLGHAMGQVGICGDLTDASFREMIVSVAADVYRKPVRIAVLAAGITDNKLTISRKDNELVTFPVELYDKVQDINAKAVVFTAIEIAKQLITLGVTSELQRNADFIFLGSISKEGNIGQLAYSMSKAALHAAVATFIQEHKKYGFKYTILNPGYTLTPMVETLTEKVKENLKSWVVSERIHQVESVAKTILQLIEEDILYDEVYLDRFKHAFAFRTDYRF